MKLSCVDRIMILGLKNLPQFGSIITLRVVDALFKNVGFTEKEIEDWNIISKPEEQKVSWNPSKAQDVEVDLTPGMIKILLEAMEKTEELPLQALPLYDRIKELAPCPKPSQP